MHVGYTLVMCNQLPLLKEKEEENNNNNNKGEDTMDRTPPPY